MTISISDLLKWSRGIPQDVLVQNARQIGEFIKKNKIQPYNEHQISEHIGLKTMQKPQADALAHQVNYSIRGGMKIPHLHFADQIYLLSDEQWKDFSGMMLSTIRERIAKTNTVNFDQLMTLASAVEKL